MLTNMELLIEDLLKSLSGLSEPLVNGHEELYDNFGSTVVDGKSTLGEALPSILSLGE